MNTLKPFGRSSPDALRLSLGDTNAVIAEELARAFHGVAAVEVVVGNLLDLACDAIVSPANSFGDMSGGIDKAIDDFHDGEAQRLIRAAIAERFLGELPVGTALIVETSRERLRFIVAAPTMRVPGSITGTINAYLSLRAVLVAIAHHNHSSRPIRSVAVPGLGTGVGGLDPRDAAEQMRAAYDNIAGDGWRAVINPIQAPYAMRGVRLVGGGPS